ncbi:MAG: S-layer homology domain-containing protein [Clostridia bacterium]|nr:S-layer homology domain-containing protein [Clostridia bacterium]
MRKFKKLISLTLLVAMLLASAVPAFAAETKTYKDLEGHWAKKYMETLVDKGIISGYSDGTIRPDKTLTFAETFVMLAGLYDLDDAAKDAIVEDYGAVVKTNSDVEWANKFIAICMAAGILTESELKDIKLTSEMTKQELALYTVRAIKMADKAVSKASAELTFKDAASIGTKYRGSVALLAEMGVVGGDSAGKFQPKSSVTRAVVATIFCNILNYLDENTIDLKIDEYTGVTSTEGVITSVSTGKIVVRDLTGVYHSFKKEADFKAAVDGSSKTLTASCVGEYANIRSEKDAVTSVKISTNADVKWAQGTITELNTNTGGLKIKDKMSGDVTGYQVSSTTKYEKDGKESGFGDMAKNQFATIKLVKGKGELVRVSSGETEIAGTVTGTTYGSTVVLNVKAETGETLVFNMDIEDMPTIKRGSLAITVDRLQNDETITVTLKGGEVKSIAASSLDTSLSGVLTTITIKLTGTSWTIENEDGESYMYKLNSDAAAYNGKTSIKLSSINVGDEVSVVVAGSEITEVHQDKAYQTSADTEKLSVEVLAVDTNAKTITVLNANNKLIYVNCKTVGSILDSASGKTAALGAVKAGSRILVYGSYTDSSNFTAKSIIIE